MPETLPRPLAVSLFSGGGGLDLGIAYAGFETRVAVDRDRHACEVLRSNRDAGQKLHSGMTFLEGCDVLEHDLTTLDPSKLLEAARLEPGEAALAVGGPPCVSFSIAGRRQGLRAEVGRLYEHYVRMLNAVQPAAFIFENVRGLATAIDEDSAPGGAFAAIKAALSAAGYAITVSTVDAADYGVPQHRHRIFVIGRRGQTPFRFPDPTHGAPDSELVRAGARQRWLTVADAFDGLPAAVPAGEAALVANHFARAHSPEIVASFASTPVGTRNDVYRRYRLDPSKPAKTVCAQGKPKLKGSGLNGSHPSLHPTEHRLLSVRESARLQTFPDWYDFGQTLVNGYRIVGDAVPPLLGHAVAASIREQLDEQEPTALAA